MKELFSANASVKSSDDVTSDNDDEGNFKREVPDNEVKSKRVEIQSETKGLIDLMDSLNKKT